MYWFKFLVYLILLSSIQTACTQRSAQAPKQEIKELVAEQSPIKYKPDSILLKYKDQERANNYSGLLVYDILSLVHAPDSEFYAVLTSIDPNWKPLRKGNKELYVNEKSTQILNRISDVEIFLLDSSPNHKANVNYLNDHGYFKYDDPKMGNFYYACDNIFITWRLNEDKVAGGSAAIFYNIE